MVSIGYIFLLFLLSTTRRVECDSCSICFEAPQPALSAPEPEWTEPHCMDASGGQKLVSVPIRYYRKDEITATEKRECLEKCAADLKCEGVEWYNSNCYTIHTTYYIGATPTQGTIKLRSSKCFNLPDNDLSLQRLKRHWSRGKFHMWNFKNERGTELKENSGACLLPTAVEGCNLVPFGSNAINRQLFTGEFDIFEGYCATTYGECGATELLKWYYRTVKQLPPGNRKLGQLGFVKESSGLERYGTLLANNRGWKLELPDHPFKFSVADWHYSIGAFTENTQIKNYRLLGDVCYFWPGFMDINCPMPEA